MSCFNTPGVLRRLRLVFNYPVRPVNRLARASRVFWGFAWPRPSPQAKIRSTSATLIMDLESPCPARSISRFTTAAKLATSIRPHSASRNMRFAPFGRPLTPTLLPGLKSQLLSHPRVFISLILTSFALPPQGLLPPDPVIPNIFIQKMWGEPSSQFSSGCYFPASLFSRASASAMISPRCRITGAPSREYFVA